MLEKTLLLRKLVFFPKKPADYDQVFGSLKNYKLIYPDVKLVYKDEPFVFAKYKK